ncbi:spore coat protein U domain-containing protein [Phyllobacterium myrsinacearum]|uniref:Spore coat protein U/FanG domain-containing protein n=1 Tax=Phyllobacterium myrsinacearum TaxID=28101 RepID=A0A2S9JE60_9HYPH|nr:spore coat protein U domain-containing protein [Phyllobacterium myrsinacearum]PRD51173.1 hypothetical protein C5750_20300 [Phyllobacterium myrsinacearum]PWV86618.1 spore coat protein U-like protein [Phyllobacterium myrsinacearum]RZU97392.1 spore coat protein U-like protein [Phyllobacterium myrsinacearum]
MKIVIPILALSGLIASSVSAWSSSPNGTLQVSMKAERKCEVIGAVVEFEGIGTALKDLRYDGAIKVQCTKGVVYSISLDGGKNSSDTEYNAFSKELPDDTHRWIKDEKGYIRIPYTLYSTANNEEILWRDRGNSKVYFIEGKATLLKPNVIADVLASGTLQPHPFTIFVRKVDMDGAPAGVYTDTVTVTVGF